MSRYSGQAMKYTRGESWFCFFDCYLASWLVVKIIYRRWQTNEWMSTGHWWYDTESKRTKYCDQTVSRSFCIHHWAGLAVNPAFRGEIPVTSRLNHGRPQILVRFPVVARDFVFCSPKPPEQLWGPHVLIFSVYRGGHSGE